MWSVWGAPRQRYYMREIIGMRLEFRWEVEMADLVLEIHSSPGGGGGSSGSVRGSSRSSGGSSSSSSRVWQREMHQGVGQPPWLMGQKQKEESVRETGCRWTERKEKNQEIGKVLCITYFFQCCCIKSQGRRMSNLHAGGGTWGLRKQ